MRRSDRGNVRMREPFLTSSLSRRNQAGRALWGVVYVLLFRPSPRPLHRWRNWLLRLFGANLHPTARIYPRARCWAPWNLTMGEYACLADDVDAYTADRITIGEFATVSQYSYLCTASHDFDDVNHRLITAPITIGARAWIAADCFVGPGVTIGEGTVVGARSAVFRDLPGWSVATGSPARVVRPRRIGPEDFDMAGSGGGDRIDRTGNSLTDPYTPIDARDIELESELHAAAASKERSA